MKIHEVINSVIAKRDFKKYLEINNDIKVIDQIECDTKEVISDTDDFKTRKKYDVIFIDADHDYDSVLKHYEFALTKLSKNGVIFFHDVLPPTEWHTRPREQYKYPEEWCGQAIDVFIESQIATVTEDPFKAYVYTNVPYGLGMLDSSENAEDLPQIPETFEEKMELVLTWKVS